MLLQGHMWCKRWHRWTLPKGAYRVQIFKLLIDALIASGQPQTSHESSDTYVARVHCRPVQKKSFFFSLVQVGPHKSLKLLHSTKRCKRYQPHCFQFLEPWPCFSREGKLCDVSYCTSQRTGSPGINCPPGESASGFSTLKACIRRARSVLVAASASSSPQPHQSSSTTEALQQREAKDEESDNGFGQLWHMPTQLHISYFTKKQKKPRYRK